MSRRKQGIPKKSDGGDEEGSNGVRTEQGELGVGSWHGLTLEQAVVADISKTWS